MKKGFTLIELLAVILILGLVVTIAFSGINSLNDRFKENQYINVVKNIEESASRYAFDTGKTMIFVDELIKNGYYSTNDDDIVNPKTDEKMNCYIVIMEKEGNYYNAKFKADTKYELENGSCDTSKIVDTTSSIKIDLYVNNTKKNNNDWVKGNNIKLVASSSTISIDCEANKCVWTSNSGIKEEGNKEISIANTSLLNTKYIFQYNVYNNNGVKRYTSSINIKIDNENPIIHNDDIITYPKEHSKDVEIVASDGNGSGISGYYLGTGNCNSVTYGSSKIKNVTSNGTYKICVKDNVGNIGSSTITISGIN